MSTISSRFSSASNPQPASVQAPRTASGLKNQIVQSAETSSPSESVAPGAQETRKLDSGTNQQPQSPKTAQPSFLQNALRRLSSSGPGNLAKHGGTGVPCQRKTMNIDIHRERCQVPELKLVKLRKVAFCVDVEIAPPAKYAEDEECEEGIAPNPTPTRPVLPQPENQTEKRKRIDQKLQNGEGETLKHPTPIAGDQDKAPPLQPMEQDVELVAGHDSAISITSKTKQPTKKKEKKKRSEDERKERKEQKRKDALANGSVPAELQKDDDTSIAAELTSGKESPPKSQDRPTTDSPRIYRRCCQLRETPILKRVTEQIGAPSACPGATPGIISVLDLSNYQMQLPDIVTLSDYLAIVPVKKLILDGCGLGDEAVRVILAGLLATKTPEQAKYNRRLAKMADQQSKDRMERLGVVEKLSLKNNPKIGRDGWRHIAFFINMSKSIKAIELSMIPIPPTPNITTSSNKNHSDAGAAVDIPTLLQRALAARGGSSLEELVMAECGLTADAIEKIVDGVIRCGVTRLGLANNAIDLQGMHHVLQYVRTGKCEGLDLGGNDLRESLHLLAAALDEKNALYALSLADCNLSPFSLEHLLPALVRLPNFRFIDLSHNHDLFRTKPSATRLLRKYIPQFPMIKRIHLLDVDLSPEGAIALAEVLPESRSLAHLNILENRPLSSLASAKDEASQEEACALYASLMVATRVSSTMICIDIDVPDDGSSEVVKALAKQIIAYSLRNLERTTLTDTTVKNPVVDTPAVEKEVIIPDILMHLVGHMDGALENRDNDEPAPDDDYIVGGTGVVKALDVCLKRATDVQKSSLGITPGDSGTLTPSRALAGDNERKGKAKEMSKELLVSARKIRARLLPALVKEAKLGDSCSYSEFDEDEENDFNAHSPPERLQCLDQTLERIIQRFENEFPETRVSVPSAVRSDNECLSTFSTPGRAKPSSVSTTEEGTDMEADNDEDDEEVIKIPLRRNGSDVSLASRQAHEEGLMHRLGQRVRSDILRPETSDHAHGTTGDEVEPLHLQELRKRLESLDGAEIREKVERVGSEALLEAMGATAKELALLEQQHPEGFEAAKAERLTALYNMGRQQVPAGQANQKV